MEPNVGLLRSLTVKDLFVYFEDDQIFRLP